MRTLVTAEKLWNWTNLLDDPVVRDRRRCDCLHRFTGAWRAACCRTNSGLSRRDAGPGLSGCAHHGAAGHDAMEATPEAIRAIGRFLASRGTGGFLATTVAAPLDATMRALSGLAKLAAESEAEDGARLLGIHLEGRSSPIPSAAFTRRSFCLSRIWGSSTGYSRLPRAASA